MKLTHNGLTLETFPFGSLEVNGTIIATADGNCIIIDAGDNFHEFDLLASQLQIKPLLQLYTHAHFDHISAAKKIKEKWQAPIALSKNDAPLYAQLREQTARFGMPVQEPTVVDYLLSADSAINCDDPLLAKFLSSMKIIETPGHTRGCICFYTEWFERPMLIAGDTLFYQSIGRTDLPGGNFNDIINSIKNKLLTLPENTLVITGHGPGTTIGNEARLNPYLNGSC